MLDDDDANEVGDGGTSDADGEGQECVISSKYEMKEVELQRLCFDANENESGVEVDDNDAFVCEVKDYTSNSSLYGAPPGWSAPSAPDDWNPNININHGEPQFEDVDNPGGWSNYNFRPMFEPREGKYICHAMLDGTVPVPINALTGKREAGGYEFFYKRWKEENPTRENCRFWCNQGRSIPCRQRHYIGCNIPQEDGTI